MTPMKFRHAIIAFAVVLFAGCAGAPVAPPQAIKAEKVVGPRLRIAVVDFENKTTYGQRLGTASADILVTELGHTDRFILIERAKLDKIMAEQKLGLTGAVNPDTAAQRGKLLGAAAIVTGAVSEFGVKSQGSDMLIAESKKQVAEAVVDIRIIDAETGQILYTESGRGNATSSSSTFLGLGSSQSYDEALEGKALRAAIVGFANNVVARLQQIPWSCRVADLDGPTIYLDAGQRTGLKLGTVMDVVHLGAEIKSPSTGLVIGHKETKLGKIRVSNYMGEDAATGEMIEGNAPSKGDMCRIMQGTPGY